MQPQDVPDVLEPLYSYLVLAFETDKTSAAPASRCPSRRATCTRWRMALTGADGAGGRYPLDLAFSPVSPLMLGAR